MTTRNAGVGVILGLAAIAVVLASPASSQNPCAFPDALLEAGEKDAARKAYIAILKRDPQSSCASEGLAKANLPASTPTTPAPSPTPYQCAAADDDLAAGRLKDAREGYRSLGSAECAKEGLTTAQSVRRLCDQGKALEELDRRGDALTAFKSALEKSPKAECAVSGVARLGDSWFTRVTDAIPDFVEGIGLTLAAILLLLFLILLTGYIPLVRRIPAAIPGVGKILAPRLEFKPVDEGAIDWKVGASITARMKDKLQRFRDEATGGDDLAHDLDFGSPDEEFAKIISDDPILEKTLKKLSELSDHTKQVAALLDLLYGLLPIRKLVITAALDPPETTRVSGTFALETGDRYSTSASLAVPVGGGQPSRLDYVALAEPAAVWAQFSVARVLARKRVDPEEAESYALVRRGLDHHLNGDYELALKAYSRAILLNPRNWAARVNVVVTKARLQEHTAAAREAELALEAMGV